MAFDAGTIAAKLRLNTKEFFAGMKTAETGVTRFDQRVGGLLKGGAIVAGFEAVRRSAQAAFASMERGARLEEIDLGFKRITESASEMNMILGGTRRVAKGLADSEIKLLANRLELVGIQAEKLPRLAEIAEAIADSTGESTKQVLDAIVTGTARSSDRMLAAIGLNVDLTKATKAYADALGKTTEELSEQEKQQVFLNEILKRGDTIITDIGNSAVTSADHLDTFKTSWRNLFEEIDKGMTKLSPILSMIGTPKGLARLLLGPRAGFMGVIPESAPDFGEFGNIDKTGPARTRAEAAAAANARSAQLAKEAAERWKQLNDRFASMDFRRRDPHMATPRTGASADIFQGDVRDPGLSLGEPFVQRFISPVQDALGVLGDSFGSFFEEIVSGSENAGRAFFSGMMNGLAGIASNLGDIFIQAGFGMLAVHTFNPFASIAAGFILKSVAGALRGVGNKNAPSFSTTTAPRRPRGDDLRGSQAPVTIHVDNFIGRKAYMEDFIRMINKVQRERGVRVEIHGAAA